MVKEKEMKKRIWDMEVVEESQSMYNVGQKKTANKEKMEQVFIGDIMLKIILRQWLEDSILRFRKLYES